MRRVAILLYLIFFLTWGGGICIFKCNGAKYYHYKRLHHLPDNQTLQRYYKQ
ncbi:hypothetical protein ACWIUD_09245 [Helicobacter sp. 23-1044]